MFVCRYLSFAISGIFGFDLYTSVLSRTVIARPLKTIVWDNSAGCIVTCGLEGVLSTRPDPSESRQQLYSCSIILTD